MYACMYTCVLDVVRDFFWSGVMFASGLCSSLQKFVLSDYVLADIHIFYRDAALGCISLIGPSG